MAQHVTGAAPRRAAGLFGWLAGAVGVLPALLMWLGGAVVPSAPVAPLLAAPAVLAISSHLAHAQTSCESPPQDEPDGDGDECAAYDPQANAQSQLGGTNCECSTTPPPPPAGDPINITIGNKYEEEADYTGGGPFPLKLRRYYNSMDRGVSPFGQNWRASYHRQLRRVSLDRVAVIRDDGQTLTFRYQGGHWRGDANVNVQLRQDSPSRLAVVTAKADEWVPGSEPDSVWVLVNAYRETERYAPNGRLLSITDRNGLVQSVAYDAAGRLATVTDPFGRRLAYSYGGSPAAPTIAVTVPDGGAYTYTFDGARRLVSVTHPDATTLSYVYGNAGLPNAITAVVDENGGTYATTTYDQAGRATATSHALGADAVTIDYTYQTLGYVTVTNALGGQRESAFQNIGGASVEYQVWRTCPGTAVCAGSYTGNAFVTTYDNNANPASTTDFLGNVTTFHYDPATNLETSRTEASGQSYARTIATTWDAGLRLPKTIAEPGRLTSLSYDAAGNLRQKSVTDTATNATRSWAYTYNAAGQVLTATDPLRNATTLGYDTSGNLVKIINPAGQATILGNYDANGRPRLITDPNGVNTTLTYDFRGNVTSRAVGNAVTGFTYDKTGLLAKQVLPDGSYVIYTHDAAHRLTGVTDALGNRAVYTLDAAGNRVGLDIYDAANTRVYRHKWTYDAFSRLAAEQPGENLPGQTINYTYSDDDKLAGINDALGKTSRFAEDLLGRRTGATDAVGATTGFGYDLLDHLTSVQDARGNATSYSVNAFGETTQLVSPDSGVTTATYDAAGNLSQRIDARGVVTGILYDALNRPKTTTFSGGPAETVTRGYDAGANGVGRLTSVTDAAGTLALAYDARGNVLKETRVARGVRLVTGYTYDLADHVASITYPSGLLVTYARDKMGRISGIAARPPRSVAATTIVANVAYAPFGPVKSLSYGNGIARARTFDLGLRVTQITDSAATPVKQLTYKYDPGSRITDIIDGVTAANSQHFGYDDVARLTSARGNYGGVTYGYDLLGNRTADSASTYGYAPTSNRLLSVTTNATGVVQSYGYAADGSITSITPSSGPAMLLGYNQAGRLATVSSGATTLGQYAYDAFGRRIVKASASAVTALFQYDRAGHLIEETDGSGAARMDMIWLGDEPVGRYDPATRAFYFVHADVLGTPQLLTDAGKATAWAATYQPFGALSTTTGTLVQNLRFPGQYADGETGFSQNGFRTYSIKTGRYFESDPYGIFADDNTYAYVKQNPINMVDLLGLDPSQMCYARSLACPENPPASDPEWRPYWGKGGQTIFHCGGTVYLENRSPAWGGPINECVYDENNKLIDTNGPLKACAGTPDYYDESNKWHHAFLDPGGPFNLSGSNPFKWTSNFSGPMITSAGHAFDQFEDRVKMYYTIVVNKFYEEF